MTTDDVQKRREARLDAAAKTRDWGTWMMFAGGILLGVSLTAFALSTTPEIQSWVRQTILTLIVILLSSGVALHAVGRSSRRTLAQLDDDHREQEARQAARHEEMMTELRVIKRNQTFLLNRPDVTPAAVEPSVRYSVRETPPSPETLEIVEMVRKARVAESEKAAEHPPEMPPGSETKKGNGVIPLPSAETLDAVRRLARRTVRRAEDNPEDKIG